MRGLPFNHDIGATGYAWWYIDAESDDGSAQLTLILFVGSVFSPHYARARKTGDSDPWQHVACNVAFYGAQPAWAFVESAAQPSGADNLDVARCRARRFADGRIVVDIDAPRAPLKTRMRGRITVRPATAAPAAAPRALDANNQHMWWPVAANASVEVDMQAPAKRWRGRAYHDCNWGYAPLADAFDSWQWMRTQRPAGTEVTYVAQACGETKNRGFSHWYGDDGSAQAQPVPPAVQLRRSGWNLKQPAFGAVKRSALLEDTPFYSRSRLLVDGSAVAMHETLDMRRWQAPWVQFLLPFRLRREAASAVATKNKADA